VKTLKPLRVVFMGTPDFAVPALQAIIDAGHEVLAVYTQPPRPKGRGQQVQISPVQTLAERHGIPVRHPKSLKKDAEAQVAFAALDADIAVVAAYGLILPKAVLDAPRHGCLNIHASALPRWRGASPIQHAILAGDAVSGVTIMRMEEGLDTGPMLLKREVSLHAQTTARSLHDELSALGSALVIEVLSHLAAKENLPEADIQDDKLATYAPLLTKEDGRVDWTKSVTSIDRQIRALNPWPGTWTVASGKRLKILEAEVTDKEFIQAPGTVVDRIGHIACGDTGLRLIKIQPENAKPMDLAAALNGHYLAVDSILG
jgi:methionyl-tRNA formyltransferase